MALCETQLWDLVRRIEPTPTQKIGAARSQKRLRQLLDSGNMAGRIDTSYLSGSYSRDTAIHPLDDVDIIFIVNPSHWRKSFSILLGSSDYPASRTILQSFARAIRYRYRVSSVFGQRRSVCLRLYHLNIDVVPAIRDRQEMDVIRIPDTVANKWIVTSPLRHREKATGVNKFQEGRFKPLVKLLKYWNGNLSRAAHLKSFAIETMAVRIFQDFRFESLQHGLLYFFDFVAFVSGNETLFKWTDKCGLSLGWWSPSIPDAAGLSGNIIEGIDSERRKSFVKNAITSRNGMEESLNARSVQTGCQRIAAALKI